MNRKTVMVIVVLVALMVGWGAGWFYYTELPKLKSKQAVKKQQEFISKSVCKGQVSNIKPGELTLKIQTSADKSLEGKELSFKVDKETTIQEGNRIIKLDPSEIQKLISPGTEIDLMQSEGRAMAIHWAAKK